MISGVMETPCRHTCLIHEGSPAVNIPIISPFLAHGLLAGGRSVFMGSPTMVSAIRRHLWESHFPVDQEIHRGALIFISDQDHLISGHFDPNAYLDRVEDLYHQTLDEGYSGVWGCGDITWEFGTAMNLPAVLEYESRLEQLFERLPQLHAICQYHKDTLPLHSIGSALLTHQAVYLGDRRPRRNPFFTPPKPLLQETPTGRQIEQMLEILAKR